MASPAKREDKLPLERALRALEDLHKSLKEFSKTDSVVGNVELNAEAERSRQGQEAAQTQRSAGGAVGAYFQG
jgi:hypothetical protein